MTDFDRDSIAARYFESLPFAPYPVQEEALLAWFTNDGGVLVSAPTGTGKTLIAEAAVFEALVTGKRCYYTSPLIALSEQKLVELQASALRWGFRESDIGLVTGNRRINPDAKVLVVVAEILLNRLLNPEAFSMADCDSVVMDEFHSFNDPERGIVWEFTLGLLAPHIRLMLLSATIGNSYEFSSWLFRAHGRRMQLVEGTERKVPLAFEWVDDAYLDEHLERMADGDEERRRTPALVFCFNRDECWQVAELLKGKKLIDKPRQAKLASELDAYDLTQGAGPKLKAILQRGIGIHHAGILPKFRRVVEELFQKKLLTVCVCTETLSAGINLPARSVVLPTIVKGPRDKRKLIEASSAHQIFGRAGRPQFDSQGFVYVLAHEDDVKYLRWKAQYDQIPEDTKDPGLLRAKKQLKKKMPKRRDGETYWSASQFEALRNALPAKLQSRGQIPWRLLTYLLLERSDIEALRTLVSKRLFDSGQLKSAHRELNHMLITLWTAGYIELDPKPQPQEASPSTLVPPKSVSGLLGTNLSITSLSQSPINQESSDGEDDDDDEAASIGRVVDSQVRVFDMGRGFDIENYRPMNGMPTADAELLLKVRSVNPLYGIYIANQLTIADAIERVQALESLLELPANVARLVSVPPPDIMPPGPLATDRLHERLLQLGLATAAEITGRHEEDSNGSEEDPERFASGRHRERRMFQEPPPRPLALGDKLRRLFDYDFPRVHDVYSRSVWVVGEFIEFDCNFNKYIQAKGFQKQEGILFRHILRFILLCDEFASIPPADTTCETWEDFWDDLIERLSEGCRVVDPASTDEVLDNSLGDDELLIGRPSAVKRRSK